MPSSLFPIRTGEKKSSKTIRPVRVERKENNVNKEYQLAMEGYVSRLNGWLDGYFNKAYPGGKLAHSMRYSLQAGGKRIRSILTLLFYRSCGGREEEALPFAAAIECIHTYSLIHDDLPAMDNDDLRRGKPTNHRVYGEGCALLAGDALLNAAFEIMSDRSLYPAIPPERLLDAFHYAAEASGARGMAGGQMLDLENAVESLGLDDMVEMYRLKTSALIRASAVSGCLLAGAASEQIKKAEEYAENLGFAFQLNDDILDKVGNPAIMGKQAGSDEKTGRVTLCDRYGFELAGKKVVESTQNALRALDAFDHTELLTELTNELCVRAK